MMNKLKKLWKTGDEYKINLAIAGLPIAAKMRLEDMGLFKKGSFADLDLPSDVKDTALVDGLISEETKAGYGKKKRPKPKKMTGKGKRPPSAWVTHVKSFRAKNPGMSYKDAMSSAGASYSR